MTSAAERLEVFLARLYTDEVACAEFVADPGAVAAEAGLDAGDVARLARVDRAAFALAAVGYGVKRGRGKR